MVDQKSWYIQGVDNKLEVWLPGINYTLATRLLGDKSTLRVTTELPQLNLEKEVQASYVGVCDYFPIDGYPVTNYEAVQKRKLYDEPRSRWFKYTEYHQFI